VAESSRYDGPDRDLVRLAREGDNRAFDALAGRYANKAYRLAFKVLRDEPEAEDAVQDAFLSAYRHLPRFEERSTFSTWLYRVTMNAALMRLRKRREDMLSIERPPRPDDREAALELEDRRPGPHQEVANRELAAAIQDAILALPEELREVFVLREDAGLSNADTAEVLGLSVPAVKSRLHRARLGLRDRLRRFVDGGRRRAPRP
jgi:RNA polymerase sigma-70 factor (ECF subfamily)